MQWISAHIAKRCRPTVLCLFTIYCLQTALTHSAPQKLRSARPGIISTDGPSSLFSRSDAAAVQIKFMAATSEELLMITVAWSFWTQYKMHFPAEKSINVATGQKMPSDRCSDWIHWGLGKSCYVFSWSSTSHWEHRTNLFSKRRKPLLCCHESPSFRIIYGFACEFKCCAVRAVFIACLLHINLGWIHKRQSSYPCLLWVHLHVARQQNCNSVPWISSLLLGQKEEPRNQPQHLLRLKLRFWKIWPNEYVTTAK